MKTGNGNYIATPSAGIPGIGVAGENGAGNVRGSAKRKFKRRFICRIR